jgi:lysozyme
MISKKLQEAQVIAAPLIKKFEGLKKTSYLDPAGVRTIGYGHTGSAAYSGNTITKGDAEMLLRLDMMDAQRALFPFVEQLNVNQLAALTSFVFNLGSGNFGVSTLRTRLLSEDYPNAANELLRWNKARIGGQLVVLKGLTRRREAERDLFLSKIEKKK